MTERKDAIKKEHAEFPLPEGVVCFEFPASLSTASYEDFQAWVESVLRRVKRGVNDDHISEGKE